jgi:hypothetical protein
MKRGAAFIRRASDSVRHVTVYFRQSRMVNAAFRQRICVDFYFVNLFLKQRR